MRDPKATSRVAFGVSGTMRLDAITPPLFWNKPLRDAVTSVCENVRQIPNVAS